MNWKAIRYISFWTAVFLFFGFVPGTLIKAYQDAAEDVAIPVLDELDQLKMSGMVKDLIIAQKNLQLLQAQVAQMQQGISGIAKSITEAVGELRTKYDAPGEGFDFNINTMQFTPVEKVEEDGAE